MPTTYPLDLTGGALTNQIANELHTFASSADRIFPLSAGPFYTIGLTVRHGVTNELLQPVTQYKALQLHRDASLISGKEVCAVIIVEDATVPSVRISYQCIGGIYSGEASLIQDLIANNPLPLGPVVWGQIIGIPVQFPPTEHLHHIDNIYGAEELVAVLERMRIAIAAGDSPAIAAIYQYIHTLLTNLNFQTEQQVIDLIGDTNVQYVKTYDSYAQLRTETHVINNESYLYIATGKGARNDRKGRMFMWDITSMAVDDNDKVLRPDHILVTNPGRFIAMLDVELDLKNALATLGRRIETNGTVTADLGVVNRIELVSMNSLITPGDYWIHSNCTDRPTNVETLALKVWRESDTAIGQQAQCLYSTENYPHNRQGITYSRASLDGGATWSPWHETFTVARAVANGLDVDLATTNATNADLNTLVRTGKYWFGNTNAHRPEYNPGLYMEYAQLEVVCLNSSDVMQRAFNTSLEAYRYGYGGGAYAGHSWTPWEFRAARNGDTTQAFAMFSHPIGIIDPSHGVNAAFLATQFATLWERLTANGIDADLGTTNALFTVDLNDVRAVGEYYINDCSNSPFSDGLLKVWRFDYRHIYQILHGSNNTVYSRYGYRTIFGVWSWTPWSGLLSTSSQRTEVFEIHIGGYTHGAGTRTYEYTVTPNDISFEIRLVSAGGPGAGGGGAANNSNEDYGGGGGGGGSSGAMALIQMVGVLPGSTINVSLGQPGAAGGISGTFGVSGTNSDSTYLSVYEPGGYGTTFAIELQGGRGGSYGWAGGTNSTTAGGGGAQVTANVSLEGFYNYRVLLGEAGGGGSTAGWQGGSGGYGGAISQQCSNYSRTGGGAGSDSGNGSNGFDGLVPTSPPYQFGRGGGGGGGGRNGSSTGGLGGDAGVAGCIIRVTRNKV